MFKSLVSIFFSLSADFSTLTWFLILVHVSEMARAKLCFALNNLIL